MKKNKLADPVTLKSIVIRARKRIGKAKPGGFDRRRWSKRKYLQLPPEAMYLSQPMDRARGRNAHIEQGSRPLGTGMTVNDWWNVRSQMKTSGLVPTLLRRVNGKVVNRTLTRKELEAYDRKLDELYQEWKKSNP